MDRLDGWKEIAAHLRLSVRHCQRLAKEAGLPVHHRGSTRAVYAWAEELDRWIRQENGPSTAVGTDGPDGRFRGPEETPGDRAPADVTASGLAPDPQKRDGAASPAPAASDSRAGPSRPLVAALVGLACVIAVLAALLGLGWWRTWSVDSAVIAGQWSRVPGGYSGRAAGVGRLDTGRWVGPGSSVSVVLDPRASRWAGGVEIHQDRLHRTQIALTPADRLVEVLRMPSGELTVLPLPPRVGSTSGHLLEVGVRETALELRADGGRWTVELAAHDVAHGRLLLAVGREGNEYLPAVPGACEFRHLEIRRPAATERSWLAAPMNESRRTGGAYTLTVDNVDDQVDVLLDGRRLVTVAYREHVADLDLAPFLTPGRHTLTALVYNRKWTTTYGVRLEVDGETVWDERCGRVNVHGGECRELGSRTGLVRRMEHVLHVP